MSEETELPVIIRMYVDKDKPSRGTRWNGVLLFPTNPAYPVGYDVESWQYFGGHGAASYPGVIANTRPPTEDEIKELVGQYEYQYPPTKLKVYARRTRSMIDAHKAAQDKFQQSKE